MERAPLLELKGIRKRFGELEVLRGVDLALYPGEILALLGKERALALGAGPRLGVYWTP